MKVDFYKHSLPEKSTQSLIAALSAPFLTRGPINEQVERTLCSFFDAEHATLTNNWTSGAIATLMSLGLGPGDEVIVPAMTFVATANVVELFGATVVFADVDANTLLMTPESMLEKLTPRTRIVIPVHLYGQMCDVRGMAATLRERPDVLILEDCAHCFEGSREGYRPGQHSTAAIFSFYATKNITCGEGGAVITNDAKLGSAIRRCTIHGLDRTAIRRQDGGRYQHWDVLRPGIKSCLPDPFAALLPDQISEVERFRDRRQELAEYYREAFGGGPLRLVKQDDVCTSAEHLFPIWVPAEVRQDAINTINEAGIGLTVNYPSIPSLSYYKEKYGHSSADHPVSYAWGAGTISLPLYLGLTTEDQNYVVEVIKNQIFPLVERT